MDAHEAMDEVGRRLAEARRLCEAKGARLSPARLRILELTLETPGPVKAYDLAERFDDRGGVNAITVYRALKFWEDLGLVRRLETLNAFIASSNRDARSNSSFFLCRECGVSAEIAMSVPDEIARAARGLGFEIDRLILEAGGRCRRCLDRRVLVNEVEF